MLHQLPRRRRSVTSLAHLRVVVAAMAVVPCILRLTDGRGGTREVELAYSGQACDRSGG